MSEPLTGPWQPKEDDLGESASTDHSTAPVVNVGPLNVRGGFVVLKPHAPGGLGLVSLANDVRLKRPVAVKEIRPDLRGNDRLRQRFLVEAEITGQLQHPGIVPVYSMDEGPDGEPIYAMRFVEGETLGDAIQAFHATPESSDRPLDGRAWQARFASMSFRELLQRYVSVCNTIAYAHAKGIIHRDLKPANVMLGDYGETIVLDWGLAKRLASFRAADTTDRRPESTVRPDASPFDERPITEVGQVLGTAPYVSPEQALGREVGPATDVYSLGAILYELLTGKRPYEGLAAREIVQRVPREAPKPLLAVLPAVPRPLAAVAQKAMARAAAGRYLTALHLADEVNRWLADEPVHACSETLTARLRRWGRKHPGPVAAIAAAIVIGIVGLAIGALLLQKKNQELAGLNVDLTIALDRTEQERLVALSVRDFLQYRLLGQADARTQADHLLRAGRLASEARRDLSVREILDRAASELAEDRIDRAFPGRPLVQAEILRAVGYTYRGLGEFATALGFLERSLALRTALLGPDQVDALTTRHDVAVTHLAMGRTRGALSDLEAARRDFERVLGIWHPATLRLCHDLAIARQAAGDGASAIGLLREVHSAQGQTLGNDHPDTLATLTSLGIAHRAAGQLPDCIAVFEKARSLHLARLGNEHPDTLALSNSLAIAYRDAGQPDAAIEILNDVRRAQEAVLDRDHPDLLATLNTLAIAHQAAGNVREALGTLEQVLAAKQRKLGTDHPDTLRTRHNLALACKDAGEIRQAVAMLEELVAVQARTLDADHPDALATRNALGLAYREAGMTAKALSLLESTRSLQVARLGHDHPSTLATLNNLATAYFDAGRLPEAIGLFAQVRQAYATRLGNDHPDTLTSTNNLATAYYACGKLPEAVELFEQAYAISADTLGREHPGTLNTLSNLAGCYLALWRVTEAMKAYERVLTARETALGPDHSDTFTSLNGLAMARHAAGQTAEAVPLFERALAGRIARLGDDHPSTLTSRGNLARAYVDAGHAASAVTQFTKYLNGMRKQVGRDPSRLQRLFEQVARDLVRINQFNLAREFAHEALAIESPAASSAWTIGEADFTIGQLLLERERHADAEAWLLRGYEGMKAAATSPVDGDRLLAALARLLRAYQAGGKLADAKRWRAEFASRVADRLRDGPGWPILWG